MGKIKTIARRSFLIGSLAVAGGVAFGVYKYKTPHENPLLKDLSEGQASITPWVKITSSGITIITPHTDKGQGSASLQAMLIAEELDLDFGQFDIDFGEPSPAYYNTAMGAEAAPFLSSDTSWTAETMRGVMGGMIKLLGMQLTGGSSTVPDGFEKLRVAGAVARETLKAAASKKSGVAVSKLKTEKGHVLLPNGEKLAYTDLASISASVEPVQEVNLRDAKDWRLIGQNVTRLDMLAKSTGTHSYGIDSSMDGMVHATVKTNPRRGGLKFFNASSASKMRGFKKAL
ncbi:MAG: xanthine dehydrogenase family protein molybdopterin-binding subunit, partial [Alphaproteobacteria bacterium]